ncbi:MAG: YigZ family protein [Winogradskyella sp.]|uniref:IMPACT family protein n=1 Tax=Winogradskyella sp. TaxID=1883156 RepID=UPI0017EBF323|nr:YigZ family protein [Winogradskyella sp.]
MDIIDTYKTITKPAEGEIYKEKNSKFIGFTFPVKNEEETKVYLNEIKKTHYAARHWCYAYQIGKEDLYYRVNDDGEPNNSAGMPIFGQIQSFNLTNILIIVVRYYGGVKLGVGGLINAYRTAAQLALEASDIIEKTIDKTYQLHFEYKNMSKVMRILKEHNIDIIDQKLELKCSLDISVRKSNSLKTFKLFDDFFGVEINEL